MVSKRTALVGSIVGLVALVGLPRSAPPPEPTNAWATDASKVSRLYERWVAKHEAQGGDRNVLLALGPGRGLTASGQTGRGLARLDLVGGVVDVAVNGLPDGAWDVWVVDNAPDESALVDEADALLHVGTLSSADGAGALRAELGADAFTRFEADVVFVTAAGNAPTAQGALYGMPTAFQRLYTRARVGALDAYPGPVDRLLDLVGATEARAAGIVVDADVVTDAMVALGADLFLNETFDGNGRTCGTCHPPSNNFTLDADFIATLPPDDPLFVAETNPALADLEDPDLMRAFGLILENVDGFDRPGVMRSVSHTLALSQTITPPQCVGEDCTIVLGPGLEIPFAVGQQAAIADASTPFSSGFAPIAGEAADPSDPLFVVKEMLALAYPLERTGWGGDGAPGGGTLREFTIGAITQHFPRTLNRVPGVDFRLPTDEELDAIELFQLSLGRDHEVDLRAMTFADPAVENGKQIFMRNDSQGGTLQAGKCETCHFNAGANATPEVFGEVIGFFGFPKDFGGNQIFQTGVGDFTPEDGSQLPPGLLPRDGGFGVKSLAAEDGCVTGTFDFSGPEPVFVPGTPTGGGWGSVSVLPVPVTNLCTEAFNTPPLVEAADTAPFFHDHAAATIEDAVRLYNTAFSEVGANQFFFGFRDQGVVIQLTEQSVQDVGAFLRVLNALENVRQADELAAAALGATTTDVRDQLLVRAAQELDDARRVLAERGLHGDARGQITSAIARLEAAAGTKRIDHPAWRGLVSGALDALASARAALVVD